MDEIPKNEYFYNRQQVMYIINSLMANEQYGRHSVINGRNGVRVSDVASVLATLVSMEDELEGIEATVSGIVVELLKQHLLKSTGEGAVMNPNPPLDLDSERVDLIMGSILDTVEEEKLTKKANKKIKDDARKAKKAEVESLELEMKALEAAAKHKKGDENVETVDKIDEIEIDEDDALEESE